MAWPGYCFFMLTTAMRYEQPPAAGRIHDLGNCFCRIGTNTRSTPREDRRFVRRTPVGAVVDRVVAVGDALDGEHREPVRPRCSSRCGRRTALGAMSSGWICPSRTISALAGTCRSDPIQALHRPRCGRRATTLQTAYSESVSAPASPRRGWSPGRPSATATGNGSPDAHAASHGSPARRHDAPASA